MMDNFIWDFWYYFEAKTSIFHIFYLNAPKELVPQQQHHFYSRVGYGITKDFRSIEYLNFNVLEASQNSWANTSIWTGDIIKIKNGFLLFFTSRNQQQDDGLTQMIGIAYSEKDFNHWRISDIRICPNFIYEPKGLPGDTTIHAWRDPFLFRINKAVYMLVSAKSQHSPLGKKGVVGLLKMKDNHFTEWDYLNPISTPNYYSEMEVPQLYLNHNNQYELIFSCPSKYDFNPTTNQAGGLQNFTASDWQNFDTNHVKIILPESSRLYACRAIPELEGEIVGFNLDQGNLQPTGIKKQFKHLDRNFEDLTFNG